MNRRGFLRSCIATAGAAILAPLVKLGYDGQHVYNLTDGSCGALPGLPLTFDDIVIGVKRQSAIMLDNVGITLDEGQRMLTSHGIDPRPYWEESAGITLGDLADHETDYRPYWDLLHREVNDE